MGDSGDKGEEILDVRGALRAQSGWFTRLVEEMGRLLASAVTWAVLLLLHLLWVVLNTGWLPWVEPWDRYPFPMLAMLASVEAPFISLMILMAQEREGRVRDVRDEIDLQVALHSEREVTAILRRVDALCRKLEVGPFGEDPQELEHMKEPLDSDKLMERVEQRLEQDQGER